MTVDELEGRLTVPELVEWVAFLRIEAEEAAERARRR